MRSFALPLLVIIALSAVNCQISYPSWMSQSQVGTYLACMTKLTQPSCSTTTCSTAYKTYGTCIQCPSNKDTASNYINCAKTCGTTFTSDATAKSDSTVTTYVDGVNSCNAALNGTILALSAFFIATFALLF
ncbi:hypothetical protein ABPG72_000443 [Tetrahymena utriculariae]